MDNAGCLPRHVTTIMDLRRDNGAGSLSIVVTGLLIPKGIMRGRQVGRRRNDTFPLADNLVGDSGSL